MLLYDRRLNDVGHRRDAQRTRSDGFDHFTATLVLGGLLEVDGADGTRSRPQPGEVLLVNTHRPAVNRMHDAHLVTLSVARERMAAIVTDIDALHGLILAADEARLLREFVESLLRHLPTMGRHATMASTGVLTALLTITIESRVTERLGAVKRLIDARIADPGFDTAAAVRESGLSRATLCRLLKAEGGLATLIRHRRLEEIRRRLADPAETCSFAELAEAARFASISHASHAFFDPRPAPQRVSRHRRVRRGRRCLLQNALLEGGGALIDVSTRVRIDI